METKLLEEIGLTKGEVSVYFALLELGSSSVGPITKNAQISSSKVYDVLERLITKGLASYVIKENAKHFEAAPPKRILEYLEEKKENISRKEQQIKQLLPELELKQKLKKLKAGAQIFKGNKGWQTAFGDILETLQKGDELLVTGIFDFDEEFQGMIKRFHARRGKLRIKARILLNLGATSMGGALEKLPLTQIKYFKQGMSTPGVFLIYADKTLITLPNQRTFIQIENEEASDAFRAYFEAIWNQEVQTGKGLEDLRNIHYSILNELKEGEEYRVLGANVGVYDVPWIKKFFVDYHRERAKRGIRAKLLFQRKSVTPDTDWRFAEKRLLPPQFRNPLQITTYKDTTNLLIVQDEPLIFKIQNKEITESFKQYFDSLWNQEVQTWRGEDAIELLTDEVIAAKNDLYMIGAHGYMPKRYPATHQRLLTGIRKNRKKQYRLAKEVTRGTAFSKETGVETHYLPEGFFSPLVIWVCGDIVAHVIWEDEMTIFRVKNKKIADDYRTYFALLKQISRKQRRK